jgi:hypothetical protein
MAPTTLNEAPVKRLHNQKFWKVELLFQQENSTRFFLEFYAPDVSSGYFASRPIVTLPNWSL